MFHSLRRSVGSLVLAPLIGLSGALPAAHVHDSGGDDPNALAHRHLQPHQLAAPVQDGDAEMDHGDGRVTWLDGAGAYQAPYQLPVPNGSVANQFELAPAPAGWVATHIDVTPPPHGPPRLVESPRAPPIPASNLN